MKASTNKEKGKAGLAIAIGYYGSNGYTVSVPLNDTQDYDLIVDKGDKLQKVQVKCTGCLDEYGRYAVSLRSCGGTNGAVYQYLQDTNVDVVFVVCIDFKLVCKVVSSSFLTLTKASTHEEVSKPEAKPLNDIVDAIIKILFY